MIVADIAPSDGTVLESIPLDELRHPHIRFGVQYWRQLCGGRRFPARGQISPRALAPVLSAMSLFRVFEGGDFEYRIAGDSVVRAYKVHLLNRRVSDIEREAPMFRSFVRPALVQVTQRQTPLALRGKIGHDAPFANFTHSENALLPIGPDDGTVDHILVFSSYERRLH